jgi:hypothetical protein
VSRGVRAAGIFHRRVQEMVLYAHGRSFACELGTDPRVAPTLKMDETGPERLQSPEAEAVAVTYCDTSWDNRVKRWGSEG